MPGVPSSRACAACRAQKKKCDQAKPSCTRCTRLDIPCVGAGQLRYKFKSHSATLTTTQSPAIQVTQSVPSAPSNEMTLLTGGFLSALQVTDIRFDLSIYGEFFKDIPRRLGTNEALDASVSALTTAWPSVHTRQQSTEMVSRYVHALKSLRVCLSDPAKAESANTLCAVYLVTICQGWIGKQDDHHPSHGEAIAYLLNVAAARGWQGSFEAGIIRTLCFLAMMESFVNPKIQLDPRLWTPPETVLSQGPHREESAIQSLQLPNLARVSALLKDRELKFPEIQSVYQVTRADCAKTKHALSQIWEVALGIPTKSLALPVRQLHVRYQTAYGTLLMLAIILNATILMRNPSDRSLAEESALFVDEVIALAQQASQYRPLGSSATPLYLVAASAVSNDVPKQIQLEKMLAEYETDFTSTRWLHITNKLRAKLRKVKFDSSNS